MSKIKLTDIETTGGTENQVPAINASGELEFVDQSGGGGGTTLTIDGGDATNSTPPDIAIDGGTA